MFGQARLTPGKVRLRQLQSITSEVLGYRIPLVLVRKRRVVKHSVLRFGVPTRFDLSGIYTPAPRSAPEAAMFSTVQFHYGRCCKSDPVSDFQSSYLGELLINLIDSPLLSWSLVGFQTHITGVFLLLLFRLCVPELEDSCILQTSLSASLTSPHRGRALMAIAKPRTLFSSCDLSKTSW